MPGWLNDAALDCLFRGDENYDGAETALSIVFSGSVGAEPFRQRVAWTGQYESMALSGYYGTKDIGGTVMFGPDQNEDVFTTDAFVGDSKIKLKCPAQKEGSTKFPVSGTVAAEPFSGTLVTPAESEIGHTVTLISGKLGTDSFRVTFVLNAFGLPESFTITFVSGSSKGISTLDLKPQANGYFGRLTGALSGPPLALIAAIGWLGAYWITILEGISP